MGMDQAKHHSVQMQVSFDVYGLGIQAKETAEKAKRVLELHLGRPVRFNDIVILPHIKLESD